MCVKVFVRWFSSVCIEGSSFWWDGNIIWIILFFGN